MKILRQSCLQAALLAGEVPTQQLGGVFYDVSIMRSDAAYHPHKMPAEWRRCHPVCGCRFRVFVPRRHAII